MTTKDTLMYAETIHELLSKNISSHEAIVVLEIVRSLLIADNLNAPSTGFNTMPPEPGYGV